MINVFVFKMWSVKGPAIWGLLDLAVNWGWEGAFEMDTNSLDLYNLFNKVIVLCMLDPVRSDHCKRLDKHKLEAK